MGDTLINIIYYLELNQHDKDFPKVLKSKAIQNTFYQILMFRFKKNFHRVSKDRMFYTSENLSNNDCPINVLVFL